VVPQHRVQPLDGWVDPADAFVALFGEGSHDAVWLDSGPDAVAGLTIIGTGVRSAFSSVAEGTVAVDGFTRPGQILDVLRETPSRPATGDAGLAGWMGWLGYESGAAAAGAPVAPSDGGPDAALLFVDRLVVFHHESRTMTVVGPDDSAGEAWIDAVRHALGTCGGAAEDYALAHPVPRAHTAWRHDDTAYLGMIAEAKRRIHAGDAYQLCVTNRAEARTDADPLAVHLRLRGSSPAHHAGFVRIGGEVLVSSSPEQFLLVETGGRVRTKPIKGTRPRGATVAADLELRAELEASEKERAENVMIVDLMRNDLGRVCETGSVEVRHLLAVESYAQVHQLVSTVEGRLSPGLGAPDAVAACFPAGSMTGAPKLSAMRILHGIERGPRGVYAGCFGRFGIDGTADLAMVIRSIRFREGVATIGAGGGITALSVPEEELEEVRVKAAPLLRAAGLTESGTARPLGTD